MTREELQTRLPEFSPNITFAEGGQWLNIEVNAVDWKDFAIALKAQPELGFDYLFCLTCVDWKTHLTMVYHLSSLTHHHNIVIKIKLDRNAPEVESVANIWRTAEFHEREVFELFGVIFLHHPDLRLLILPDGWEGFPLRKDYEDPVNMIKL